MPLSLLKSDFCPSEAYSGFLPEVLHMCCELFHLVHYYYQCSLGSTTFSHH